MLGMGTIDEHEMILNTKEAARATMQDLQHALNHVALIQLRDI